MPKVHELKKRRNDLVGKARAENDRLLEEYGTPTGAGEYRALSPEDKAAVEKILAEADSLDQLIESLESLENVAPPEAETDAADAEKSDEKSASRATAEKNSRGRRTEYPELQRRSALPTLRNAAEVYESKVYRDAFLGYCKHGNLILPAEYRDMTLGTNSSGGYLVTPNQLSKDIIMAMNNLVFVRQLATIETLDSATSLGVRQISTQPSDAAWTTEIGSVTADSTMAMARRDLTPQLLTKMIAMSIRLNMASPDAERLVRDRIAYKFAIAEENAFMNGSGSGQPLGMFTASASGIPTSQDFVVTAASSSVLLADSMVAAKYQLKQQYLGDPSVRWIFNRYWVSALRTLKDSQNRYLWFDGGSYSSLDKPAPPTFDGIPIAISEYAPNSTTAGAYMGILGAIKYYQIADVRQMEIQRLVELLAGTSEIGFLGRRWLDGSPVLAEAFVRLQIHS